MATKHFKATLSTAVLGTEKWIRNMALVEEFIPLTLYEEETEYLVILTEARTSDYVVRLLPHVITVTLYGAYRSNKKRAREESDEVLETPKKRRRKSKPVSPPPTPKKTKQTKITATPGTPYLPPLPSIPPHLNNPNFLNRLQTLYSIPTQQQNTVVLEE